MNSSSRQPMLPLIGRTLGDFVIERLIGTGGMGEVYLARQVSLPRPVALKILRPDLAEDAQYLRRFEAEAKAIAPISHPNIVSVYAIGHADGLHFIAFEYVRGLDLRRSIDRHGPMDEASCLRVARCVAAALVRAGSAGIVHRDIKPENVLLTRKGEVKVADFGLARQIGGEDVRLTQTGVTMGTPLYMSPEQIQGGTLDARSDIYSLGIMCYHMLAGEPPFRGETAMAVAIQHVHGSAEPLASLRPEVRPQTIRVINRMMAKSPADRFPSAESLLEDLDRLMDGREHLVTPWGPDDEVGTPPASGTTVGQVLRMPRRWLAKMADSRWRPVWAIMTVLVAMALGGAMGTLWRERVRRINQSPRVEAIPTQANGFMQYSYAQTISDPVEREQALWAVLLKHRGDDTFTIQAAQELADRYLVLGRHEELDQLARYLVNREDIVKRTYGYLLSGVAVARRGDVKSASAEFDRMFEMAGQTTWTAESVDWVARTYFLTLRSSMGAETQGDERLQEIRQRFWSSFRPEQTSPTP